MGIRSKKKSRRAIEARYRRQLSELAVVPAPRLYSLDAVRGFAILLMVVDHVALILFKANITPDSIRFYTRLAMPLFAILMGFFLAGTQKINHKRLIQLALATVTTNIAFFHEYNQVDILASLLVCYLVWSIIGKSFAIFCVAGFLYPFDSSSQWFDFSLTVAAALVAQGIVLRLFGSITAVLSALVITASATQVTNPTAYAILFTLPATIMIVIAAKQGELRVPLLATLGRYPLSAYLIQYYLIFAIAKFILINQ